MNEKGASEGMNRADVATLAIRAYYQQPWALAYNLDEALDALGTFMEKNKNTVYSEQQKHYLELD